MTNRVSRYSAEALEDAEKSLDQEPAVDILRWASDRFGERLVFATAFGAEGCVLIDLIGRNQLPIDIFTLDTGLFFEETYTLWRTLEARYGLTIRGVEPATSLSQQASEYGDRLWERNPNLCCSIRKVAPIESELGRVDAWISSIRRSQTPERSRARVLAWDRRFNIVKINPLVHWAKSEVWEYIQKFNVPYNPLHDQGYPSIGCWPCTSPVSFGEPERAGRWRNCKKNECGLHSEQVMEGDEELTPYAL